MARRPKACSAGRSPEARLSEAAARLHPMRQHEREARGGWLQPQPGQAFPMRMRLRFPLVPEVGSNSLRSSICRCHASRVVSNLAVTVMTELPDQPADFDSSCLGAETVPPVPNH